jgi:hypothetical protein
MAETGHHREGPTGLVWKLWDSWLPDRLVLITAQVLTAPINWSETGFAEMKTQSTFYETSLPTSGYLGRDKFRSPVKTSSDGDELTSNARKNSAILPHELHPIPCTTSKFKIDVGAFRR